MRVVIKLGTSSIVDEKTYLPKLASLSSLVETVEKLRIKGIETVIVSSGAIGVGLKRLNLEKRPKHLPQVQAVAAVGQGRLMALYDSLFGHLDIPVAQVLLTREAISERAQYLNACNTFKELLSMKVVPIVNENDTVSHAEIRFGDNDTLSGITAGMINAEYLFLLTDVDSLYSNNPRIDPNARAIRVVEDINKLKETVVVDSSGSSLGTGGMMTKIIAADLATAAGCSTIITLGSEPGNIITILDEIERHKKRNSQLNTISLTHGTLFVAKPNPMVDRKWWIQFGLSCSGTIYIDAGATKSIISNAKTSLFSAGIVHVEGTFSDQQSVRIVTIVRTVPSAPKVSDIHVDGRYSIIEVGKGLVNYTSDQIERIKGRKSSEIVEVLGFMETEWVVHRDNLVVTFTCDVEDLVLEVGSK